MIALGVTDWIGGHDSSASIVVDGQLIAAAEEERFTRRKHDGAAPLHAVQYCLRAAGITIADVDVLAFPALPFRSGPSSSMAELDRHMVRRLFAEGIVRRRAVAHKWLLDQAMRVAPRLVANVSMFPRIAASLEFLREALGVIPSVRFFGHHQCHAAAAFFTSGVDRAAIATLDERGQWYSTATWIGEGQKIVRLDAEPFTNSLGAFYSQCTDYLRLGEFAEGKLMGLAPYGNPDALDAIADQMLELPRGEWYRQRRAPTKDIVGFEPRINEDVTAPPYRDFAAAAQRRLEQAIMRVCDSAAARAQTRDLCVGGGVALNCSANGKLAASGNFQSVSVFPASGDAGLSVGAAFLCSAEAGFLPAEKIGHAYWGPAFSSAQCEEALLRTASIRWHRPENLAESVAEHLAQGKIVGWFQGRMELGPRALGNRSILADPRSTEIRDRVNRLKGREHWRPLAPSVVAERASEFFEIPLDSRFMLFAAPVRPAARPMLSGVVHVDGSARPQLVHRHENPGFHALLKAFGQRTGVPVLLNTSFNTAGEPIVCSPQDALRTFSAASLDFLVLGDILVERQG